jgi:hypothetical protein
MAKDEHQRLAASIRGSQSLTNQLRADAHSLPGRMHTHWAEFQNAMVRSVELDIAQEDMSGDLSIVLGNER